MIAAMQPFLLSPAINGEPGIGNNEVPSGVGREYFEGNHAPDYNQDRNRRDF
jgi:hypothetical protein